MLVYGKNVAREVLRYENIIKKVYLSHDFNEKEINNKLKHLNIDLIYKTKHELDKLVENSSQGIVLDIKDYNFTPFSEIENDTSSDFIVMLDRIEDPHNFGAIIRTCECAGVDYIIVPDRGNANINATVMKTSSGALLNVKICKVVNLRNTIDKLKKLGFFIIGSDANGEDYNKVDFTGKNVLVIGSEGEGLKYIVRENCDIIASIPMRGKINSLNASVAAGILIYEAKRGK